MCSAGSKTGRVSGQADTSLVLNAVILSENGNKYEAIFSNSVGSKTSKKATLRVH